MLLALFALAACQHATETEYERTRRVSASDIAKLPPILTYDELLRRWGPAKYGDPYSKYRTTESDTELAIFIGEHHVVAMYLVAGGDWASSRLVWGHDILSEIRQKNEK
jgi:hypothetical protein